MKKTAIIIIMSCLWLLLWQQCAEGAVSLTLFPAGASEGEEIDGFAKKADGLLLSGKMTKGTWLSPFCMLPFEFCELIPSVNLHAPPGTSFSFYVQLCGNSGLSPWIFAGSWGEPLKLPQSSFAGAFLNVDYLTVVDKYDSFRIKIEASSNTGEDDLLLKSVNIAASTERTDSGGVFFQKIPDQWLFSSDLPVPFRSQCDEDPEIAMEICSPVSCAMVMDYFGESVPSNLLAASVYCAHNDMYGMWWRSVQACSDRGFCGYVRYFRDWEDVINYIAEGIPVVACISDNETETAFEGESLGHVIVISGFDKKGMPICRDCGWSTAKEGIRTYSRKYFEKVWFNKAGGIGYIIFPDITKCMEVTRGI